MRRRKIDNFGAWRDREKKAGRIKDNYPVFKKDGNLAELIGVVLGDGHIGRFPRCESLRITGNSKNAGFTNRYANLVRVVFDKQPSVAKVRRCDATIITLYQKNISNRLGIPTGSRANHAFALPEWISRSKKYRIRFLRGLYEAEGSECHHLPTSTHKLFFSNRNSALLTLVSDMVQQLGFKVNIYRFNVQVSRQAEVQNLRNLLEFRHYES